MGEARMRVWICLVLCCLAGCQKPPPLGTVSGRVTLGKEPVRNASIVFEKEDGNVSVFAYLDPEGRFKIQTHDAAGLPPGKYRVAVRPAAPAKESEALVGQETPLGVHPQLHERFNKHATSNLSAVVKVGENPEFHFDLGTME